jgi:hypothetical protein
MPGFPTGVADAQKRVLLDALAVTRRRVAAATSLLLIRFG